MNIQALFGRLSGLAPMALDAAIAGVSVGAGMAAAHAVVSFVKGQSAVPQIVKDYAGVIPFVLAIPTVMYVRRLDSRVAVGAAAGMSLYGLATTAAKFQPVKDVMTKYLPVGLGEIDMGIERYLNGAPITAESLQGAPTTIESLRGGMSRRAAATLQ